MAQETLQGKKLEDLTAADLVALKNISEGWYHEYKQQILKPDKIAKSISSFANTYGGWIFYGVRADKETRNATDFPGIPEEEIANAEMWIRQAVSGSMSPAAYFEHKIIAGPLPEMGLPEGRSIIAVYVPQGLNAPYVHSAGKIYRRVADESDPREETDRHFLDLLWNRSKDLRDDLKQLISQEHPRQSKERATPFVRILIFHDLWRTRKTECALRGRDFHTLMAEGSLIFDNIYATNVGTIARQVKFNDPIGVLFAWHHRRGCIDEITIPFSTYSLNTPGRLSELKPYKYSSRFIELCYKNGAAGATVVDISIMYQLLIRIFTKLNEILEKEKVSSKVHVKLQICGASGCIPYLDVEEFITVIEQFGLPVIQDNIMYVPPGFSPDSMVEISHPGAPRWEGDEPDSTAEAMLNAVALFFIICAAFGIDYKATGFETDEDGLVQWHTKLIDAATRSYEVSEAVRGKSS